MTSLGPAACVRTLLSTMLLLACGPAASDPDAGRSVATDAGSAEDGGAPRDARVEEDGGPIIEELGRDNPRAELLDPSRTRTVTLSEVPAALAQAQPFDTILVEGGTYTDVVLTLTYSGEGPVAVRPVVNGEVIIRGESPITIRNTRGLILSGFMFHEVKATNTILLDNSHEVYLTENYFVRNGASPSSKIVGVSNGSSHNEIHHNTFDESHGQCVGIYNDRTPEDANNTHNAIYRNLFYRIPSVSSVYSRTNGLEAVQLGQGAAVHIVLSTSVYENLFEQVDGDGSEIISVKTSGNRLYRNTFLDNPSGFTIRLGDSNEVYSNYFENTEKGIRTYGYNQRIERNYFVGGRYGIQLPSGDTRTGEEPAVAAPYWQSDRTRIAGNVIVRPSSSAFLFGTGYGERWPLLPIDMEIERNDIFALGAAVDYGVAEVAPPDFDPIVDFAQNRSYLESEDNRGHVYSDDPAVIEYLYGEERELPSPESITGVRPFESLDWRVGAEWKRPE